MPLGRKAEDIAVKAGKGKDKVKYPSYSAVLFALRQKRKQS